MQAEREAVLKIQADAKSDDGKSAAAPAGDGSNAAWRCPKENNNVLTARAAMANQRVMIVGGGLAGLAAAMKLAELGIDVDLMSLTPVKRSHSVCAQGGINSVNDVTRQQGDSEWLHFDDTVYGGDFLQHQPPVKEMTVWGPKIIDLMDRLGVPFNRTPEGFRDQRRFGGTLFKRTAFCRRDHRPAIALRAGRPGAPLGS